MGRMSPLQSRENMAQDNLRTKTGKVLQGGNGGYNKEDEARPEVSDKRNGVELSAPARLSLKGGKFTCRGGWGSQK